MAYNRYDVKVQHISNKQNLRPQSATFYYTHIAVTRRYHIYWYTIFYNYSSTPYDKVTETRDGFIWQIDIARIPNKTGKQIIPPNKFSSLSQAPWRYLVTQVHTLKEWFLLPLRWIEREIPADKFCQPFDFVCLLRAPLRKLFARERWIIEMSNNGSAFFS